MQFMKNTELKPEIPILKSARLSLVEKPCLFRIALVRYIDSLFYEAGDARWCHSRCYTLIVRDLFGIGENTFRHYLRYPSDRLAGIEIPRQLLELLGIYVMLIKRLLTSQAVDFLHELHRLIEAAFNDLHRQGPQPDAGRMIETLKRVIDCRK